MPFLSGVDASRVNLRTKGVPYCLRFFFNGLQVRLWQPGFEGVSGGGSDSKTPAGTESKTVMCEPGRRHAQRCAALTATATSVMAVCMTWLHQLHA